MVARMGKATLGKCSNTAGFPCRNQSLNSLKSITITNDQPTTQARTIKMRFTSACMATGLLGLAVAHLVGKRADTLPPIDSATDESVVQLALYHEYLEFVLYSSGYDSFTDAQYTAAGFPVGFRENVGVIASVCTL